MPYIIEISMPQVLLCYKEPVHYVFKTVATREGPKKYKTTTDKMFAKRYKARSEAQYVVNTRYPTFGRVVPV